MPDNNKSIYDLEPDKKLPPITSPAVEDPYVRGLMLHGVQQGQTYNLLTPQGFEAEQQRRSELLRESVMEPITTEREVALEQVEKQYQRAGKLSSSATTRAMMGTVGMYDVQAAAELTKGELSIYEQLDRLSSEERQRILESGVARLGAETGLYGTEAERAMTERQLATGKEIAGLDVESRKAIAEIQAGVDRDIAQIEADTTLTGYEKQEAIANIQAASDRDVATINAESREKVAKTQVAGQITITGMNVAMNENIATWNLDAADLDRIQRAYEFNIMQTDADGNPRWLTELNSMEASDAKKLELARDRLEQEWEMFDITTEEGSTQFWENIDYMRDKMGMENRTAIEMVKMQITNDWAMFNLSEENGQEQFDKQIQLAYDTLESDEEVKSLERGLTMQLTTMQIGNNWAEYKLSSAEGQRQFDALMEFNRDKLTSEDFNKDAERALARQVLAQEHKEFSITSTRDMYKFNQSIQWEQDRYGIDDEWRKKMWNDKFKEDIRQFNFLRIDKLDEFRTTMEYARANNMIDREMLYEFQYAGLAQQMEQMTIQNAHDFSMWSAQERYTMQRWQIDSSRQYGMNTRLLELQEKTTNNELLKDTLGSILTVLKDPAVFPWLEGADDKVFESFMGKVLDTIVNLGEGVGIDMDDIQAFIDTLPITRTPKSKRWEHEWVTTEEFKNMRPEEQQEFIRTHGGSEDDPELGRPRYLEYIK